MNQSEYLWASLDKGEVLGCAVVGDEHGAHHFVTYWRGRHGETIVNERGPSPLTEATGRFNDHVERLAEQEVYGVFGGKAAALLAEHFSEKIHQLT